MGYAKSQGTRLENTIIPNWSTLSFSFKTPRVKVHSSFLILAINAVTSSKMPFD
jgi:hypothetical protein